MTNKKEVFFKKKNFKQLHGGQALHKGSSLEHDQTSFWYIHIPLTQAQLFDDHR
jgi:hypothetical protein